ncbi:hypothetical protein NW765_004516 [Fusarium oxysporum]|nr:hypothetical protein NW765_004516 [Fusarium oxysporum]
MAVQMFEKWRLPDMLSDAKLALATAMTSETPGPSHEAAIQILKESLRLDEKRNDVQRQLKKLETIVSLVGCLARADQGDRHKELQSYWMGESERIGERYHNDDSIRQAELFMAREKFKSAEKLLRQRLKQRYLSSHTPLVSSERLLEEGTLHKLNGLVSRLSLCTHEGDLLVFCPTRTLHAILLHSLKIEGVPMIWRNLLVYTASVSLLRQCCKRANSKLHERARGLRTAFFSAYEDHIEDKVKITQREEAYKCMRKLASDFGSEPRLGCNANRENLTTVVKDVDVLHFHGHTATHPNIIYQSLVLSDGKTSETSSGVQEFHHTQSSTSPYRPTLGPHKDAFTVRDAFSLDLNLSLASIVACSSGVQNYGTGDEPQGLLSALQYAGCATAIGTLWPLHSEDGRAFTLYFFQAVRRRGDNIASPWNLALSFQKAVRRLQGRKKAGLRLDHPYHRAAFHGAWYL